ncbi:MAG: hypothetical protein B7X29_03820 [Halothiobacillus sp. 13-55-115]|nr:MAG: hypothetical protein B7X29_03820 [Halothiobacillus sp. 13-55-115]
MSNIGGVISVLLSNQQTYRTNQALSQVQDGSRTAFEFLARDIRQAGLTGCGNLSRVANVLNNSPANGGTAWWADFSNALHGYGGTQTDPAVTTGTGTGERVANTDSIQLIGAEGSSLSIEKHDAASATFHLYNSATGIIAPGDIVIVCSPDHAAITQITGPATINDTVVHNTGTGNPGNCSKVLNYPTNCGAIPSTAVPFPPNSQLAKLSATDWYIGNNTLGACSAAKPQFCSLYRSAVSVSGGNASAQAQEIVRGVTDMKLDYLQGGASFIPAASVTDWGAVTAVRVTLTVAVPTNPNNANNPEIVQRVLTNTVTLRNRVD